MPVTKTSSFLAANIALVNFAAFTPAQGTDTYYVAAEDTGTTPGASGPANYNFVSKQSTIQVNSIPTLGMSITNSILDNGQSETFNIKVNGGTGPFSVELYNITGSKSAGSVTIQSPTGSNSISFTVHTLTDGATFTYNAIATIPVMCSCSLL